MNKHSPFEGDGSVKALFPLLEDDSETVDAEVDFLSSRLVATEILQSTEEFVDVARGFGSPSDATPQSGEALIGLGIDVNLDGVDYIQAYDGSMVATDGGRLAGILLVENRILQHMQAGDIPCVPIIYLSANPDDKVFESVRKISGITPAFACLKEIVDGSRVSHYPSKVLENFRDVIDDLLHDGIEPGLEFSDGGVDLEIMADLGEVFTKACEYLMIPNEKRSLILGFNELSTPVGEYFLGNSSFPSRDWPDRLRLFLELRGNAHQLLGGDETTVREWFWNEKLFSDGQTAADAFLHGSLRTARAVVWHSKNVL
ncbi:hypothetical protein [Gymnodinialimonas sp.]